MGLEYRVFTALQQVVYVEHGPAAAAVGQPLARRRAAFLRGPGRPGRATRARRFPVSTLAEVWSEPGRAE